ncbi:MAG: ribbon-helix-helix protein, CopG family [Gemmatimonadetes bacterium]|nr:ribbon-helix-helix protein, CopG family [Gemmatimonadota bacterium]MYG16149.1 ribbon-helix-helix protein, CopG family [Gemmatimonadota bacterium]
MSKRLVRTVINLEAKQKAWLDSKAAQRRVSRASLIRQAVSEYQVKERRGSDVSLHQALEQTSGIWRSGDGLEYQVRIRKEWQ